MLSAAQLRGTPAAAPLALFGQAVLPGVHPPAHRGLQELDRPRRAPAAGRRGRRRAADRGRGPVPADRSADAGVGGPAHHEAAVAPAVQPLAAPVPQAARGAADADPLGARAHLRARPPAAADRAAGRRRWSSAAPPSRRRICWPPTTRSSPSSPATSAAWSGSSPGWPPRRWAAMFEGYVAQAGPSLPDFVDIPGPLDLVVLDPGALSELSAACRHGVHRRPPAPAAGRRAST